MIDLKEFSVIFNYRHTFNYEDIDYLPTKYSHIRFDNIPEAWVPLIDNFLNNINDIENIKSISQFVGHLVVKSNKKLSKKTSSKLIELERNTIKLDIDLHNSLGEGIVLN